ncbi:MAG TPA: fumarate reductase/succinate dehydrogenase flavoprotein subunit, partial [Nannocystis sp.]
LPATVGNHLAGKLGKSVPGTDHPAFAEAENGVRDRMRHYLSINGKHSVDEFHRELGLVMWDHCGMARNEAGLKKALQVIPEIRERFWKQVRVPGVGAEFNQNLERAGRVADFLEFGELLCLDALTRDESCGGHFREEHQMDDGEAKRNDERFAHAAVWEYKGADAAPARHEEPLEFEHVHLATRVYT